MASSSLAIIALFIAAVPWVTGCARSSNKLINITNGCMHTVWPEISSAASSATANTTVFELAPGQWRVVLVPSKWSGRVWGRTVCTSTDSSGKDSTCVTGGGPVTLPEFTLGGMDLYDVSPLAVSYAYDYDGAGAGAAGWNTSTTILVSFCASGKISSSPNSNLTRIDDGTTPTPCTGGSQSQVVSAATPPSAIALAAAVLGLVNAIVGLVTAIVGLWGLGHRN